MNFKNDELDMKQKLFVNIYLYIKKGYLNYIILY